MQGNEINRSNDRNTCKIRLSQNIFHYLAVDISEPVVPPLEAEGKLLMIETEQMHNCGLEVVDMNFVAHDRESKLIRFTILEAALNTASGEKN